MDKSRSIYMILGVLLLFAGQASAQAARLQSGPMLGYNQMREVAIWLQTSDPCNVAIKYWPVADSTRIFVTEPVQTSVSKANTAQFQLGYLEPGQRYRYQVMINGYQVALAVPTEFTTQSLWQWRADPPPFSVALGSCSYINEEIYDRPGRPYGGEYEIFETIAAKNPDVMLWLGDNTYLREPDWYSRSGILHRNTHTRSIPELQKLLATAHHYAIWDDHDYGPNDTDGDFVHKNWTEEAFQLFWANPSYGVHGQGGITSFFQYNDMDFFLLDNRYFRTPNNRKVGEPTILGKVQLEWLINSLVSSRAPFKFVAIGGQVLNTAKVYETYANLAPEERAYLLRRIEEEQIKGVVFLTGDRHHTELSHYVNGNGHSVYDLTVSPLTSGTGSSRDEVNGLRVENTLVIQHNFGLLNFSGPRTGRVMNIQILAKDGSMIWEKSIKAE